VSKPRLSTRPAGGGYPPSRTHSINYYPTVGTLSYTRRYYVQGEQLLDGSHSITSMGSGQKESESRTVTELGQCHVLPRLRGSRSQGAIDAISLEASPGPRFKQIFRPAPQCQYDGASATGDSLSGPIAFIFNETLQEGGTFLRRRSLQRTSEFLAGLSQRLGSRREEGLDCSCQWPAGASNTTRHLDNNFGLK